MEEALQRAEKYIRSREGDIREIRGRLSEVLKEEEEVEKESLDIITLVNAYIHDRIFDRGDVSIDL